MLKYEKIFEVMESRGLRQTDLRDLGIHPRTFQKLKRGELLRTDVIDNLCRLLDCQPGDIMEWVPDEPEE